MPGAVTWATATPSGEHDTKVLESLAEKLQGVLGASRVADLHCNKKLDKLGIRYYAVHHCLRPPENPYSFIYGGTISNVKN